MRQWVVAQREGNIYLPGTTSDKDLHKKFGWHKKEMLLGSIPEKLMEDSCDTDTVFPQQNVNSTMEGGVQWMNELLSKAISAHNSLLDPANVRDWTAKDLDCLPADQQKEWQQAQFEELEALRK
jgi:asparagine synthetase B (glutamine-hydrolysing)